MPNWSNEPKPHEYQPMSGLPVKELYARNIKASELSDCVVCGQPETAHTEPEPPEVEAQRMGAPRLEGF